MQDEYLKRLIKFAVAKSEGTHLNERILESLRSDTAGKLDNSTPPQLAKLPSKEKLLKDLSSEIPAHSPLTLLFVELDHFKTVNDQLGHPAGDKCLVETVELIGSVIIGKGNLYRCGGDEFAIVLANFSMDEARATAERIRTRVAGMPAVEGRIVVTASIGLASTEVPGLPDPHIL